MSIFSNKGGAVTAPPPAAKRIPRGTNQQEALWDGLVKGGGHVLAEARAGCGKSSSCREAMWRMLAYRPGQSLRYAVFNRANADEFRPTCPAAVEVATSHSFGYAALKTAFRSRVEKNKTYLILDETPAGRNLPRYLRKSVAMLAGHAKNNAVRPDDPGAPALLERLALHYDVNTYGRAGLVTGWALDVLKKSAEWVELCDFDDMLWLAAVHGVSFPACDGLFLDECQDFNPTQHQLIPLMSRAGRVVAVGDRHQAINAFRGADMDSIPNLEKQLGQAERGLARYPLTITFRCPKSHVALANALVPDLTAHESAPDGAVEHDATLDQLLDRARPGDLVICPTNAPVVSACLKKLARRQPAYVRGRAIGEQLLSILRGVPEPRTVADACKGVDAWRSRELNRLALLDGVEDVIESVQDRANGLQAILSACESPAEAEPLIGSLFSDDRRHVAVTFSTVHRAKGDEAGTVWLIEAEQRAARRDWQARQARNLRYVALTRSKDRLIFVNPEDRPRPNG